MRRAIWLAPLLLLGLNQPARAAFEFSDIACETTSTSGTGTVDLGGALTGGYLGFAAAGINSGATVPYHIKNGAQLETGIGTFTDGTPDTLSRTADWSTDGVGAELTLSGSSTVCVGPIASLFKGGVASFSLDGLTLDGEVFVGTADPGADGFYGFDDTADQYELLSAAEAIDILETADGTGSGLDADTVDGSHASAFAGTALSNLGSVAVNTTIASDTDSTDSLGTSSIAWLNVFTDNVEFGASTANTLTCSSGTCTIEGDAIKQAGKQTVWIPAPSMTPRGTNGCAQATRTTNSITIKTCNFDTATDEAAQFTVAFPKNWNAGTVTFQSIWTAAAGTATNTVAFEVSCGSFANDVALNSTGLGTAIEVSDALIAANDVHLAAESSAITLSNPADDTLTICQILRDVSEDTIENDVELIGIKLFFTDSAANDD